MDAFLGTTASELATAAIRADVVVIGGGHAGIEAAAAAARMGMRTIMVTQSVANIGRMSCNPSVGGLAKGQLVREIDALGGLMGTLTDQTGIQFRILNSSKGAAVQAPRAQADRAAYANAAQTALLETPAIRANLSIVEGEVHGPLVEPADAPNSVRFAPSGPNRGAAWRLVGVKLTDGRIIACGAAILCTGTFMRGLLHCGTQRIPGGRHGAAPSVGISEMLGKMGFDLRRLKTGTSPRIDARSIDYSNLEVQPGDDPPKPFSFTTDPATFRPRQLECHATRTTAETHRIIRENIAHAPMFNGQIEGSGPRYCPSIEDKVMRFPDRDDHLMFIEPEGFDTHETYVSGISTSLPAEVQEKFVRTIPGLENAVIMKPGYAVEYDFLPAAQVDRGLMTHTVAGFFLAGQILGTSGYEEAAGQGIVAGINAAQWLMGHLDPFALGRDQAYIGVMIDDLITKVPLEPYRMFTSRAEHRLLLRSDNADRRLTRLGAQLGAVDAARLDQLERLEAEIARGETALAAMRRDGRSLEDELRRPDVALADLIAREPALQALNLSARAIEQIEIDTKYAGYLKRQQTAVEKTKRLENLPLPKALDYHAIKTLSIEARERLSAVRPDSVGQASRIAGVRPSDIGALLIHLNLAGRTAS